MTEPTTTSTRSPKQGATSTPESGSIDARPILFRSEENAWERTEQIRARLYHLIEDTCRNRGIEALVLESDPYIHPAWVKFESWLPAGKGGVTARAEMTVTITTMPYHRYESIYKVEWQKHGRHGAMEKLYEFGECEVAAMIDWLLSLPKISVWSNQVKRILDPVQLRQRWWDALKPFNEVVAIRRDWPRNVSLVLAGTGALLVLFGFARIDGMANRLSGAVSPFNLPATSQVFGLSGFDGTITPFYLPVALQVPFGLPVLGGMVKPAIDNASTAGRTVGSSMEMGRWDGTLDEMDYRFDGGEPQDKETDEATDMTAFGLAMMLPGVVGLVMVIRAPRFTRSAGKPLADPRTLFYLDSWQTVVFGAGHDGVRSDRSKLPS